MAAGEQPGALVDRGADLLVESVEQVGAGERPEPVAVVERVADRRCASTASTKRRSNSSATASATMKRLAEMQLWPPLRNRARAAIRAATARSASSRTMNGSEPPSSSTLFFSARPAAAPTAVAGAFAAGQRDGGDARVAR